jgi:hypothetical protein
MQLLGLDFICPRTVPRVRIGRCVDLSIIFYMKGGDPFAFLRDLQGISHSLYLLHNGCVWMRRMCSVARAGDDVMSAMRCLREGDG